LDVLGVLPSPPPLPPPPPPGGGTGIAALSTLCGYTMPGGIGAVAYGVDVATPRLIFSFRLLGGGVLSVLPELLLLEAPSSSSEYG